MDMESGNRAALVWHRDYHGPPHFLTSGGSVGRCWRLPFDPIMSKKDVTDRGLYSNSCQVKCSLLFFLSRCRCGAQITYLHNQNRTFRMPHWTRYSQAGSKGRNTVNVVPRDRHSGYALCRPPDGKPALWRERLRFSFIAATGILTLCAFIAGFIRNFCPFGC